LAIVASPLPAQAGKFTNMHTFSGGEDGRQPTGRVVLDADGNLYGVTPGGGGNTCFGGTQCGVVFKIAPDKTESVLYNFKGGSDGASPYGELIADKNGNRYGTTFAGGGSDCSGFGCGTVFKLAPDGSETVLYAFAGGNDDGSNPDTGLVFDTAGNLYGVTQYGGGAGCYGSGCGTVFKVAPDGKETVLHIFAGGTDGAIPSASLIVDATGNLYGTTDEGGATDCDHRGCGTVFKIAPDGSETVLHAFQGGNDGAHPRNASLLADQGGNQYGTTAYGGSTVFCAGTGCGTVFKLAPNGTETLLHVFKSENKGTEPFAGVIADGGGNLYGTTVIGGKAGAGTIFKLAPDGTETVLHSFKGYPKGGDQPYAGLTLVNGYFYGTTHLGGKHDAGTVYRLKQ
jgi:uncharacterized repeat protein (TIGR03803 family)